MIENPIMNIKKSVHYKWPIFSQYEKIRMHFVLKDESLEEQVLEKYQELTDLDIQSSPEDIRVFAKGKMNGNFLEIQSSFGFSSKNDYTEIKFKEIEINEWDLFWLIRIFKNRLLQPLKINDQHLFDSKLSRIESILGVNHFYYIGHQ